MKLFKKIIFIFLLFFLKTFSIFFYIRFSHIQSSRIAGIVSIQKFLYEKRREKKNKWQVYIIFYEKPLANLYIWEMLKREFSSLPFYVFLYEKNLIFNFLFNNLKSFFIILNFQNTNSLNYNKKLEIRMSPVDNESCYDILHKFGLNKNSKWICIHNRDNAYLNTFKNYNRFKNINFNYHDYRNFSVNCFEDSCKYLTNNNYFVFRMGKVQNEKIIFHNSKFIDYAFNKNKSDKMDYFLLQNCVGYLGSDSGIGDICFYNGVPIYYINFSLTLLGLFVPGPSFVRQHNFPIIFKHLYCKKKKKKISLNEMFRRNLNYTTVNNNFLKKDIFPTENSKEEILDFTKEMISNINNVEKKSCEIDEYQKKFWDIYYKNTKEKRYEDIPFRIGSLFLKKNTYLLD